MKIIATLVALGAIGGAGAYTLGNLDSVPPRKIVHKGTLLHPEDQELGTMRVGVRSEGTSYLISDVPVDPAGEFKFEIPMASDQKYLVITQHEDTPDGPTVPLILEQKLTDLYPPGSTESHEMIQLLPLELPRAKGVLVSGKIMGRGELQADVQVMRVDPPRIGQRIRTDKSGEFHLTDFGAPGRYSIRVFLLDGRTVSEEPKELPSEKPLVIRVADNSTANLVSRR